MWSSLTLSENYVVNYVVKYLVISKISQNYVIKYLVIWKISRYVIKYHVIWNLCGQLCGQISRHLEYYVVNYVVKYLVIWKISRYVIKYHVIWKLCGQLCIKYHFIWKLLLQLSRYVSRHVGISSSSHDPSGPRYIFHKLKTILSKNDRKYDSQSLKTQLLRIFSFNFPKEKRRKLNFFFSFPKEKGSNYKNYFMLSQHPTALINRHSSQ